ncbi:hypothetical protein Ancab_021045 [Ancistrocladus abbreviatus]
MEEQRFDAGKCFDMGEQKIDAEKHRRPLFDRGVWNQLTTFFINNLLEIGDTKTMWRTFMNYGRVWIGSFKIQANLGRFNRGTSTAAKVTTRIQGDASRSFRVSRKREVATYVDVTRNSKDANKELKEKALNLYMDALGKEEGEGRMDERMDRNDDSAGVGAIDWLLKNFQRL